MNLKSHVIGHWVKQMFPRYLTMTLLAVLLACGSLFSQKPGGQTPAPKNKAAEALVEAGDKLADERKWNEAIDVYQQATRLDPQNADAYVGLGNAYMGMGKWTEALVAYKKAVALAPQSADAQYALGDAYNTMGMHGDAFAPLVKAMQLDPTFAEAYYGIGYAYMRGQQYSKSLSFLNSAIRLKPDYEDAHYSLAVAYLNLGNQKGIDEERNKLVRLNSALVKKLDSDIDKFNSTASEALGSSRLTQSPAVEPPAFEVRREKTASPAPSAKQNTTAPGDPAAFELALWESIKNSKDSEDFNYYLRKYPNGEFAELARIRAARNKPAAPTITPPATSSVAAVTSMPRAASNQSASGSRPELVVVTGHTAPVGAVAVSPDGKTLATGDGEGAIKLWTVPDGVGLRTLLEGSSVKAESPEVLALAFSNDGRFLAAALVHKHDDEDKPNAGTRTEITIWDVKIGRVLRTLPGINIAVQSVAFSPDGRLLASGGNSNRVTLWDVATGREFKSFYGHSKIVDFLMFAPDGAQVSSGNWSVAVDVWTSATGEPVKQFPGSPQLASAPLTNGTLFNSETNRFVLVPFSTATALEGTIIMRDSRTLTTLKEFKWDSGLVVKSFGLSQSGKTLASGDNNGDVRVWDVDSGSELLTIRKAPSHDIVVMSPDSTTIATTSDDGKSIRLWDTSNETTTKVLTGHSDDINRLAFSPDSKILASSSDDKTIRLWSLETGETRVLTGHTSEVGQIVFHPSGKILASIGFNLDQEGEGEPENAIRFWDVESGKEVGHLPDPLIPYSIAFSPDGSLLAVGNRDGSISLLDASGKGPPKTLKANNDRVVMVAFMSGDILQSISLTSDDKDGSLSIWQISNGQLLRSTPYGQVSNDQAIALGAIPFIGFSQNFYTLPVKGNGITIFARTAGITDATKQQELVTLYVINDSDWLVVTPDGLFDGSPGAWARVRWRFKNDTFDQIPIDSFFNDFYYPGLLTDVLGGKRPTASSNISGKDRQQPQLRLSLSDGKPNSTFAARNLRVQIDVAQAPAGAQDVRLFRNGSLVRVWRGDVLKGQRSVSLATTVPIIAGENKLTAYAFNHDNIKSLDASLTVTGADSLKRKGIAYVLAVGVNEYANSQYNLKYAVADARAFASEFKTQQAKLNSFERVDVIPILDREATKTNILKSLTDLSAKVQPEDALIIYFAGHGSARQNRFYLIPHDIGQSGSLQDILSRSLSDEELGRAVEDIDAGQMLLVIDACNSGQALESEDKRRGPMNSKGLAQLAYDKGMYILTAAQSYQAALEAAKLGHGFLTYALVEEGLKTNAADRNPKDGEVILREWIDFATRRVPQLQKDELDAQLNQGRQLDRIKFAEADSGNERKLQHPRVFYRRETESHPLVVSISGSADSSGANKSSTPMVNANAANAAGDAAFWKQIENSTDQGDFEEYLKSYPGGTYAPVARLKVRKLRDSGNSISGDATRSSPGFAAPSDNVTSETIESKYKRGLMDEVINDSRRFLSRQPDNPKVNVMLGFALLSQQKESESVFYLDKGFLGGEPVTVNVRRHRFVGPLLQDGSFDISVNRLLMRYGSETYSASFNQISNFEARSYGQSGTGLFIKGKFVNNSGKEENKDFNLFAPTAVVRQVLQGLTMVPIVSCLNCDGWTSNTVNLFNHLRSVSQTNFSSGRSESLQAAPQPDTSNSAAEDQVFRVSHVHVGLVKSLSFPGLLYVSRGGIRFVETANPNDNFAVSCQDIKELQLSDDKLKSDYKRANCRYLHVKIGGRNYNFEADTLSTCTQGAYRTPQIVKAIADACGIVAR
jgi:WD40 repeat protein